jgi:hypothetical protein
MCKSIRQYIGVGIALSLCLVLLHQSNPQLLANNPLSSDSTAEAEKVGQELSRMQDNINFYLNGNGSNATTSNSTASLTEAEKVGQELSRMQDNINFYLNGNGS